LLIKIKKEIQSQEGIYSKRKISSPQHNQINIIKKPNYISLHDRERNSNNSFKKYYSSKGIKESGIKNVIFPVQF